MKTKITFETGDEILFLKGGKEFRVDGILIQFYAVEKGRFSWDGCNDNTSVYVKDMDGNKFHIHESYVFAPTEVEKAEAKAREINREYLATLKSELEIIENNFPL